MHQNKFQNILFNCTTAIRILAYPQIQSFTQQIVFLMNFNEIASVPGKPGLYKIMKPARQGIILETLDDQAVRLVIGGQTRVTVLSEVSVYTTDENGSCPLDQVLIKLAGVHENKIIALGQNPGKNQLNDIIARVLPEYDTQRVYGSHIQKIVRWYNILIEFAPQVFDPAELVNQENANIAENAQTSDPTDNQLVSKAEQK